MSKIKFLLIGIIIFITLGGCNKNSTIQIVTPGINGDGENFFLAGEQAYQIGDYSGAINGYLKAIEAYTSSGSYDQKEMAFLYFVTGQCYTNLTQYGTAIKYFEKSLDLAESILDNELCFENYRYLLKTKVALKDDLEIAIEYGKKAEKKGGPLYGNNSPEMAEIYGALGDAYFYLEKNDKAETYLKLAIKIYGEESEDSAIIYGSLADLYENQGAYTEAEEILDKTLDIFIEQNNIEWIAIAHRNLGDFYHNRKDHDKALNHYELSLELYSKTGQKDFTLASCYYNRGTEYYYVKEFDKFISDMVTGYQMGTNLPESELVNLLFKKVQYNMKMYYDYNYEGNKSGGFDAWLLECLSNQPE